MTAASTSLTARRRQALLRILARKGSARLTDLAGELEVSIATVRRDVTELDRAGLLSRRQGVAVLENERAGAPRNGAPSIGMVVAQNRYLLLIADAVRREAQRLNVRFTRELAESPADYPTAHRRLLASGCRGVIYAPQWRTREEMDEPVPWLVNSPVPTVLAGREVDMGHPLFEIDSVTADHRYAMRLAVTHLYDLGHRRIVASIRRGTPPTHLLGQTFLAELARLGLPELAAVAVTPDGDEPDHRPLVDLIRSTAATAIIVHTDDAAQELAQELRAAGTRVPRDCSIVGYDDIVGPVERLALTSVSPPKHQLGHEALSLLLRRHVRATAGLAAPPVAHVRLLPELVVRDSTAPPRAIAAV